MFSECIMAPADPILGLTEAYQQDTHPQKVNLGVGIYKNEAGLTPVLQAVKKAEAWLLEHEQSKSYLAIEGDKMYAQAVSQLLFGAQHPFLAAGKIKTAQVPGGTGGLRVAADFLHQAMHAKRIWVSKPTWANHHAIFKTAGFEILNYTYYDAQHYTLDFAAMTADLDQAKPGDVVLFHTCCHNPTGADPSLAQWQALAQLCFEKELLPLFDSAYIGFHQGLEEDTQVLRLFANQVPEMLVVNSFSKNFSMYNERIGSLSVLGQNQTETSAAFSQIKRMARTLYSNPPAHGALVIGHILQNEALRTLWEQELAEMRERIAITRKALVKALASNQAQIDFQFIEAQNGMFSFSGLNPAQVQRMRQEFGVYMVESGRISVAGLNTQNLGYVVQALHQVLA
jgi:aromatic-amino-acid transaminase